MNISMLSERFFKVTGNVSGDIIDGWRKAEILKTIATVENIRLQ